MRVTYDLGTRIEIAQHGRVARLNRLVNRIELLVRLLHLHLTRNSLMEGINSMLLSEFTVVIK